MSCPFCHNPNEPSWITCQCPASASARTYGFKHVWITTGIPASEPAPSQAQAIPIPAVFNPAAPPRTALLVTPPTPPETPKATPPLPQKDSPTREVEDCGPEASAFLMDPKSAFSPWNQAILRFSEGIAATNRDLAGWIHRAASAFLAGEPIPKRRPPKVAGKATKAARAG